MDVSSLQELFSLVEELQKKYFLGSFYYLQGSLSYIFTSLMIAPCFSSQTAHYQNLAYLVQPTCLGMMSQPVGKGPFPIPVSLSVNITEFRTCSKEFLVTEVHVFCQTQRASYSTSFICKWGNQGP